MSHGAVPDLGHSSGQRCRLPAPSSVCSHWAECLQAEMLVIRVQGVIPSLTRDALAAQGCANYPYSAQTEWE